MSLNLILNNVSPLKLHMFRVLVARDRKTKLNRLKEKAEFSSSYNRKVQDPASVIAGSRGPQRYHQDPVSSPRLSSSCPRTGFLLRQCLHKLKSSLSNLPSLPAAPGLSALSLASRQKELPSPKSSSRSPRLTVIDPNWVTCLSLGANHWGQGNRMC